MHRLLLLPLLWIAGCSAAAPEAVGIVMETELGRIDIELYPEAAPITAANFLALVDGAHLDGGSFYRAVSPANDNGSPVISVIQGGLADAASPLPPIEHESTARTGLRHVDGSLSMARGDVGTASTEFFITIGPQPALDFGGARNPDGQGFAVFGRVVAGMDVVRAIHDRPADRQTDVAYVAGQLLTEPVRITRVARAGLAPATASDTGQ